MAPKRPTKTKSKTDPPRRKRARESSPSTEDVEEEELRPPPPKRVRTAPVKKPPPKDNPIQKLKLHFRQVKKQYKAKRFEEVALEQHGIPEEKFTWVKEMMLENLRENHSFVETVGKAAKKVPKRLEKEHLKLQRFNAFVHVIMKAAYMNGDPTMLDYYKEMYEDPKRNWGCGAGEPPEGY